MTRRAQHGNSTAGLSAHQLEQRLLKATDPEERATIRRQLEQIAKTPETRRSQ